MDFGVPEVPKLITLSKALFENSVYPPDCKNPDCTWAINVCFHVKELPPIDEVRSFFCSKLGQYTKLCSVVQPEDGAWYPTALNPLYHVTLEEPANPLTFLNKLLNTPLDMSKPLWRVHMIKSTVAESYSMVVFRVHHCVTDGVHLSRLLSSLLAHGFAKGEYGKAADEDAITKALGAAAKAKKPEPPSSILGSLSSRILSAPSTIASYTAAFVSTLAGGTLEHKSPLNRPESERASDAMPYGGDRKVLIFPGHSVAYVKALKRVALTSFNAVVLSIMTGALRRYCDKVDPDFRKKVEAAGGPEKFLARASAPMALPVSKEEFIASQGLCNHFSVISTEIALGYDTPASRLEATHNTFEQLRSSPVAAVTAWQEENLLHQLPAYRRQLETLRYTALHSFDFSSVPGPPMGGSVAGSHVEQISIVLPQMTSQLILLSYDGMLYPTLTYDPKLLPTADRCLSSFYVDELKELGRAFHLRGDPLFATDWEACMPEKSAEALLVE